MLRANTDLAGWMPNDSQWVTLNEDWVLSPNPDPTDVMPAKYPRVRLAYTKYRPNLEEDSCGSQPILTLQIDIWTGAQHQRQMMELIWGITRAMTKWREYVRDVVTWNGKQCVYDVDPEDVDIAFPDIEDEKKRDLTRGTAQWVCAWRGNVKFNLTTADLQAI